MSKKVSLEIAENQFQTGKKLEQEGKLPEAIASYREAIELNPNNAEFHRSLGEVLQRVGQHADAIASYRQAIELQPKLSKAYHNLGNALSQLKQWSEAIASYRQAIELNPNFPTACYRLGEALQKIGEVAEAIASYRQAIELNPSNPDIHRSLGELLHQQGNYQEALTCYYRAIELQPQFSKAYYNLGNTLNQLKQESEAIAAYRQAIELNLNIPELHFSLGELLQQQGKHAEAIACYHRTIELQPKFSKAYHNLGNAFSQVKQWSEAIAAYRQAIELKPNSPTAYYRLGEALQQLDSIEEAIAAYQKAIELKPEGSSKAYYNLGELLGQQQQWEEAISCYRQSFELDPNFSPAYHKLTAALAYTGRSEIDKGVSYSRSGIPFNSRNECPKILFILPVKGGGGGAHSVVQESLALYRCGIPVQIAVNQSNFADFLKGYAEIPEISQIAATYQTLTEFKNLARHFSVVCATTYSSVKILEALIREYPHILPAYYIQDYEPLFAYRDTPEWEEARQSYTLIPHAVQFAKTHWLCEIVHRNHSAIVHKVEASIDHQVYYPRLRNESSSIEISMMVRFTTARRAPRRTLAVAKILSELFPNRLHFTLFGSDRSLIESAGIPLPENTTIFPHLRRSEVANLLRNSDIFLDLSDFQAFGRTAIEAMASGCIPVVPDKGGTDEFAIPDFNSVVVDPTSIDDCIKGIAKLIQADASVRLQLKLNAIETASRYSPKRAAFSIYNLFCHQLVQLAS